MRRGVRTVIAVLVTETTDADAPPKVTRVVAAELVALGRKFVPVITTCWPPSGVPEFGAIAVTVIRRFGSTQ